MSTTAEVANDLIALCREGKNDEAMAKYYHQDIVSIEADGEHKEVKGLDAVAKKGEYFMNTFEVHGSEISDPIVSGNHFSMRYQIDVTHKESNQRMKLDELCVYEVNDGKIVREEFFYPKGS